MSSAVGQLVDPGNSEDGSTATISAPYSLGDIAAGEYETVAASQTAQILGPTGAVGNRNSGFSWA